MNKNIIELKISVFSSSCWVNVRVLLMAKELSLPICIRLSIGYISIEITFHIPNHYNNNKKDDTHKYYDVSS